MDFITSFLKSFGLAILDVLLLLSLSFFGLVLTINQTILNPDFTVSQVNRLDVASLSRDIISGQILSQAAIPLTLPIEEFIGGAVNETITDLEPWLEQQAREVTYSLYDYLEGRSQHLSVVIQLEPVQESLRDNLTGAVLASPPPGLTDLPPDTIERYLSTFYKWIPSSFEFDEAWLGSRNMAQLEQLKQLISHFHTVYYALIGFILLLILGIVLIQREVRGSTRSLGVTFLSCGILSYVGVWLTKSAIGTQLVQPQVPVYLQAWLPQFLADTIAPMEVYSFGLAGVGIILLIVSFVYRRQAE